MIHSYKRVAIVYGGSGRRYAEALVERICDLAEKERYPLKPNVVLDNLLTGELLSDVAALFSESEFCVAFLTADDCCGDKKGLRQNVIFEIGMALSRLGRERCLFLSDFDIKDPAFALPSDMNGLEIRIFDGKALDTVLPDITDKLLKLSRTSLLSGATEDTVPRYDRLLDRERYFLNYEHLFRYKMDVARYEGKSFLNEILDLWAGEGKSLPHFDERALFLLERIGFIPIFGRNADTVSWLEKIPAVVGSFSEEDVAYYGSATGLNFLQRLLSNVADYTLTKTKNTGGGLAYRRICRYFEKDGALLDSVRNPLVKVVFLDYYGLACLKVYDGTGDTAFAAKAQELFGRALEFSRSVDLSMQVWAGFLTYNLARAYGAQGELEKAEDAYLEAIRIRESWIRTSAFHLIIRNALSTEYFLAKINYVNMCRENRILDEDACRQEYHDIKTELDGYCNEDICLDQVLFVRQMIEEKLGERK